MGTVKVNKDQNYLVEYARRIISEGMPQKQQDHVAKGKQWLLPEDTEAFFKDESGQDRNRINIPGTLKEII